jgi:hypothetical protein
MLSSVIHVAFVLASATPLLVTSGQSLSQGLATSSALSTTQPYTNTMPSVVAAEVTGTGAHAYETWLTNMSAWPTTPLLETSIENPRSGAANYYRSVTGIDLHIVSGSKGGAAYTSIKKGTSPFDNLAASIEAANSRSVGGASCTAIYMEHGESDHQSLTTRSQYTANLVEFHSDVAAKCRTAARGGEPPLFIAQFSSWTASILANHGATSLIPMAVYDAARQNYRKVALIGPHYQWTHAADGVHMTAASSRAMGALAGKAIAYGSGWQPLWPRLDGTAVSRTTNVITVYLYTPVPPLVVDTTNITGVSASTRGFEYTDDSSPPAISSVDCSAACSGNICSCAITLASTPTGANKKLRYAYTGTDTNSGGPTSGPRGNIRDSDTATWQGANLYNWLVHFEETVP